MIDDGAGCFSVGIERFGWGVSWRGFLDWLLVLGSGLVGCWVFMIGAQCDKNLKILVEIG